MVVTVSVVYLGDGVAKWELPLAAQYHKSVYTVLLTWERSKIHNSRYSL